MLTLSNRAHTFARPESKTELIKFFTEVLGCTGPVSLNLPGLAEPVLAFTFPDGGSISIEFTPAALSEEEESRGTWLEIAVGNPEALQRRVESAGISRIDYHGSRFFYFRAPGGQVFRITEKK